jgi:hypothetical protein
MKYAHKKYMDESHKQNTDQKSQTQKSINSARSEAYKIKIKQNKNTPEHTCSGRSFMQW